MISLLLFYIVKNLFHIVRDLTYPSLLVITVFFATMVWSKMIVCTHQTWELG